MLKFVHMKKNIVLIGFMGAGKSLVSKRLANKLKRERVSTDEWIEKEEGKTIAQIFRDSGEAYFRGREENVVGELSPRENLVIDCGGGVAANQSNIDLLKKQGTLFYLKTSPAVVYQRVKNNPFRPLLQVAEPLKEIEALMKTRQAFYEQAHFVVDTDLHTVEDTAREILELLAYERT